MVSYSKIDLIQKNEGFDCSQGTRRKLVRAFVIRESRVKTSSSLASYGTHTKMMPGRDYKERLTIWVQITLTSMWVLHTKNFGTELIFEPS